MACAALYARHSDDKQNEASIEDQFRLCREHAARERWQVVGSYEDAAISGASTILRPGFQRLMRDAQQGDFNILLAEALDRISRDQADMATLFKHLKFAGIIIVTLAEGEITELHVGLKGTMNALFLKDLVMNTHRAFALREISAALSCRIKISSAEAAVDHAAPLPRPFRIARSAAGILGAGVYHHAHRNYARSRSYGSYNSTLKSRIPYVHCGGRLIDPMDEWTARQSPRQ